MADQVGAYFDNGQPAWFVEQGTGKPYHVVNGKKQYLPPRAINPSGPSGAPSGGVLHGAGVWNPDTGQFDQHLAGGNILALATGAAIGAPWLAGVLGAGGGAAGGAAETGGMAGDLGTLGVPASLAAPEAAGVGASAVPALTAPVLAGATPAASVAAPVTSSYGTLGVPASLSNAGLSPVAASSPSWLSPLVKAAVPGALAAQHFLGGGAPSVGATTALPPEMQAILSEFARRVTNQGPLADATTAQALAGLPRLR